MKPTDKRRAKCWWQTLLLLALGCQGLFAAQPYQPVFQDPMSETWRWRTFPELSGLGAQCLGEATDGSMWFGTLDGLWCYDGLAWTNYSEAAGACTSLAFGNDGSFYSASRWDIKQCRGGDWSRLFSVDRQGEIRKITVAPDGSVWAATSWGLAHGRNSNWTLFTAPEMADRLRTNQSMRSVEIELLPSAVLGKERRSDLPVRRYDLTEICADRQGRIWQGTAGGEVICFNPTNNDAAGRWSIYNESDGLACGRNPSILQLQDGAIWVVYANGSGFLNIFDGRDWQKRRLADAGLAGDCGNLLQSRDGTVWVSGRYWLGAYRDGRWRVYQKPAVPIPSANNFIFESSGGALWIGGPNTELQRVDYGTARWLTLRDLNFGWESPAGSEWFLHRDGRVVAHEPSGQWISYGVEDGLMDSPVLLLGTRSGDLWAAGSHEHTAATARFDGHKWTGFVHDDFAWGVDWRAAMESSDGSVWFGAAVDSSGPKKHLDGILQFRDGRWIAHHQPGRFPVGSVETNSAVILPATQRPEPIGKFLLFGESCDGTVWAGRSILVANDGKKWSLIADESHRYNWVPGPAGIHLGLMECMFTTRERDFWIGTRQSGAVRYDGRSWKQFQGRDSLVANSVRSLTQTADGSIWAATDRGASRFDGLTWTAGLLPDALTVPEEGGNLKAGRSGKLWVNRCSREWAVRAWPRAPQADATNIEFWTVCHQFSGKPPQTTIVAGATKISQPGNISILWHGAAAWQEPQASALQFSFRLDGEPWSAFTFENGRSFFTLPSGSHHFEVRARDRDFNVDPTPAYLDFIVLPPVWKQAWFLALMVVLIGSLIVLSVRVLLERARLREAHDELESRVRQRTAQLEAANQELEAFSYSVSHDLRAPLRSIDGFSRILIEDCADRLGAAGRENLDRVRTATQRMARLIDELLTLSRHTRAEIRRADVDLSALARAIAGDLQMSAPARQVEFVIAPGLVDRADPALTRAVMENLLGNAWKFTGRQPAARIEFGRQIRDGVTVYFVRDNGAGFNMQMAEKLFAPFQRLHTASEFPGIGIGLATVQRIIRRHGGRVWADSAEGQGATFFFTLSS